MRYAHLVIPFVIKFFFATLLAQLLLHLPEIGRYHQVSMMVYLLFSDIHMYRYSCIIFFSDDSLD